MSLEKQPEFVRKRGLSIDEERRAVAFMVLSLPVAFLVNDVLTSKTNIDSDREKRESDLRRWILSEDLRFTRRQGLLKEGDEGLNITRKDRQVIIEYSFHLHPLKELRDDAAHLRRFQTFVVTWMNEHGGRDDWEFGDVDTEVKMTPNDKIPVPQMDVHYSFYCVGELKPGKHGSGLIA